MQILGGTEISVHRALAVGRDQYVAACCRWTGRGGRCRKRDAGRADVVGKDATELVVLHLADEGRARTEACHAYDGIRRRAAGNLHRRTHGIVEFRGLALIDQLHGALAHVVLGEKRVMRARNHIDNRIADTKDVETHRGHLKTLSKSARTIAVKSLETIVRSRRPRGDLPSSSSCAAGREPDLRACHWSCHLAVGSARLPAWPSRHEYFPWCHRPAICTSAIILARLQSSSRYRVGTSACIASLTCTRSPNRWLSGAALSNCRRTHAR